jgi:hypothetical protein
VGVWRRLARMELPTDSDYDIMLKRGNVQNMTRIAVAGRGGMCSECWSGGGGTPGGTLQHMAAQDKAWQPMSGTLSGALAWMVLTKAKRVTTALEKVPKEVWRVAGQPDEGGGSAREE